MWPAAAVERRAESVCSFIEEFLKASLRVAAEWTLMKGWLRVFWTGRELIEASASQVNVVLELTTPIEGQVLPIHQKGILIKGSPLAFTRIQNDVLLLMFVFVIRKISGFPLLWRWVGTVSNIRMNRDVKDGSGRKFFVWCLLLCSASAIVSVHRSVCGRTRSWRPWGHTKGQPVTFTALNGCKSVWLFISVSFLFWRDTCGGAADSSHVIHRHVGIQSWKCSIHRFWIQVHTNVKINGFLTSAKLPTFLFSSLQLEDGVHRVKSVFSLLYMKNMHNKGLILSIDIRLSVPEYVSTNTW